MKSHIVNELKQKKIFQKIITKLRNRTADLYTGNRPLYQYRPTGHSAAEVQNTPITCTMWHVNVYIQRICAIRYRASIGQHRFLQGCREALLLGCHWPFILYRMPFYNLKFGRRLKCWLTWSACIHWKKQMLIFLIHAHFAVTTVLSNVLIDHFFQQNKLTITFNKMITSGKSDWWYPIIHLANH